jgi:Ca2+:H+ antiporter
MMKRSIHLLLAVVPITILTRYALPDHQTLIFGLACASMIPLAAVLSDATEQLAMRTGPTVGALLNVTFGNAGELVIGFFALRDGLPAVVKASISGSILVNLLLTLGIAMLAGGIRHKTLTFNALRARTQSTTLALAAIALIFPAAYHYLAGHRVDPGQTPRESELSLEFAILLLITYGLNLLFTLYTHRDLLARTGTNEEEPKAAWTPAIAVCVLAVSAAFIGWLGEILVSSLEPAARMLGFSNFFIGLVVVAVAGNAAESTSAIRAAARNRMDLAVGIAIGSSIQIALFIAPVLVAASFWIGPHPLDLVFTPVELLAVLMAIGITTQVAGDGDSNWMEGVLLIVVYLLIAAMVFSLPPQEPTPAH